MAMTGLRTVTAAVGRREQSPPEAIVEEKVPALVRRLPERTRGAVIEAAHWTYGTGGGVVFGLLPAEVRRHPAAGPAYGLAIWLAFDSGSHPSSASATPGSDACCGARCWRSTTSSTGSSWPGSWRRNDRGDRAMNRLLGRAV